VSFRAKILLSITLTVVTTVVAVAWAVSVLTSRSFEDRDRKRNTALLRQFRSEFNRRAAEAARRLEDIAGSPTAAQIAADPDPSQYLDAAAALAGKYALDFLEITGPDTSIISSAQWPARFGYKEEWIAQAGSGTVLRREELADGPQLGLIAVKSIPTPAGSKLFAAGGLRLDQQFVGSLAVPEGTAATIIRTFEPSLMSQDLRGFHGDSEVERLVAEIQKSHAERSAATVSSNITGIPLMGNDNALLAILLVGSSRADLISLTGFIHQTAAGIGLAGVLLGVALSFWVASRITRPVRQLAGSVRQVARGNWETRAEISSSDEIGQLAEDFNGMTQQLRETRERMLQAERVAAWRELARRLAHELKNPLFPLQITIENLQRSRSAPADLFGEIFEESTTTLLAELENLKRIVARFSDFARMPTPDPQPLDLNALVRTTMKAFDAQFRDPARKPVTPRLALAEDLPEISADPEQIQRALRNLVLNALDAMPEGGTLTILTHAETDRVILEVTDTGQGLTSEECERLFTPYYTTKQHGTGLGLAIVQSIVSDHGASISVRSDPGQGATFRIEFKNAPAGGDSR
jgi:two-component system nitrogen regulation sensor histidine kinase NtrY